MTTFTEDQDAASLAHYDVYLAACPSRDMFDILASKWSALAIGALEDGPLRFGVVKQKLDGISAKSLSQTLQKLEANGLVNRTVFPEVPLHVEYSLTELGLSAGEPLRFLRDWVEANVGNAPQREAESNHTTSEPTTNGKVSA